MSEADRRRLLRTEWGVVHHIHSTACAARCRQAAISASGYGDRGTSLRRYSCHRAEVAGEVEIPANRIDDLPTTFSGGISSVCRLPATW